MCPYSPRLLRAAAVGLVVGLCGLPPAASAQGAEEVLFFDGRSDQTASPHGGVVIFPLQSQLWRFWYQDVYHARVSPDGSEVVYRYNGAIVRAGIDGQDPQTLVANGGGYPLSWSPDGQKIAYFGANSLIIIDRDGAPVATHYGLGSNTTPPSWSPDGTKVACIRSGPSGSPSLYTVDVESGAFSLVYDALNIDSTHFYSDENLFCPTWSPDGTKIAVVFRTATANYTSEWNYETTVNVSLFPASGGTPTHLATFDPEPTYQVTSTVIEAIAWSPDGSELVYALRFATANPPPQPVGLYRVPAAGGASQWLSGFVPGTTAGGASTGNNRSSALQWTMLKPDGLVVNEAGDEPDADPNDGVIDTDLTAPGFQITLRAAIEAANALAGADTITFDIAGGGTPEITPASPLPTITGQVTIDATTQPGVGTVRIRGNGAVPVGLTVDASHVSLCGLTVTECATAGIDVISGTNHVIERCLIGTDQAGTTGIGNGIGIKIRNAVNSILGGFEAAGRNVISGNTTGIDAAASSGLHVASNFLGVAPDGETPMSSTTTGIRVEDCAGLVIGAEAITSIINARTGILGRRLTPDEVQATGAVVKNVFFNLGISGNSQTDTWMETALCVEDSEAVTVGGPDPSMGNVFAAIQQNAAEFVRVAKGRFEGNQIGTDPSGTTPLPVLGTGIQFDDCADIKVVGSSGGGRFGSINAVTGILVKNCNPAPDIEGLSFEGLHFNLNPFGADLTTRVMMNALKVEDSSKINLGGPADEQRNVFGAIQQNGIDLVRTSKAIIQNLSIGTDREGTTSLPVAGTGMQFDDCADIKVLGSSGGGRFGSINAVTGILVKNCNPAPNVEGLSFEGLHFNLDPFGVDLTTRVMLNGLKVQDSSKITLGGPAEEQRNVFGAIQQNAIDLLGASGMVMQGLQVGTDRAGTTSLPVMGTAILMDNCADTRVIGGSGGGFFGSINAVTGILMSNIDPPTGTPGVAVEGLNFNMDPSGLSQLSDVMRTAVSVENSRQVAVGGSSPDLGNAVAGTLESAIEVIASTGIEFVGNRIGVARASESAFAILGDSLRIDGPGTAVSVVGNAVQNAAGAGVNVTSTGINAVIRENRIVKCGAAIQRAGHQVTSAIGTAGRGSTRAQGVVAGAPGETLMIDFYAYDPSATSPELDLFIGTTVVVLDGSGSGSYDVNFPATAPLGWLLTTIVTSDLEGTTEPSTPLAIAPPPDSDGDGFPDDYEAQFPGVLDAGVSNDPDLDSDGDGLSDGEEFALGTDPTDGGDSAIGGVVCTEGGFSVEVRTVAGRRYTLQRYVENPAPDPWVPIVSEYVPIGGLRVLTDPSPPPLRGIYRVASEIE
jgi:hypothetical protein